MHIPTFGQPAATLKAAPAATAALPAPYYLRLTLADKPGALAKLASALGQAGVSINRMRQYAHDASEAPVLIVTHKCTRDALDRALAALAASDVVLSQPVDTAIGATPEFEALVQAVVALDLVDTLSDRDANLTVFAPTDDAFRALADVVMNKPIFCALRALAN